MLTLQETTSYDAELVRWHEDLPSLLSDLASSCPEQLHRVRFVMKWRWQNIRIVLHRPVLLSIALRRTPFAMLSADEKIAVGKCRLLAAQTIEDISNECLPDLISGWNAVWFVFQAAMVPLVSLFSDASMPDEALTWRESVETAIAFMGRMEPWSISAKKSLSAVQRLYGAAKMHRTQQGEGEPGQQYPIQHPHAQMTHFPINTNVPSTYEYNAVPDISPLTMNNPHHPNPLSHGNVNLNAQAWNDANDLSGFWDGMMWDTNMPDTLDMPFGLVSGEYEFQGPGWMGQN